MSGAAAGSALRVGMVAGESSGDQLGAALIEALRARVPDVKCSGVAGPRMIAAGCEAWANAEELAVMGFTEVIPHLPRLLRLRRELVRRMCAAPPHVFVGVDFKEFNLSLARKLKDCGIRTVQYVSPQVWAWRPGRVKTIARAVDVVLCLLPFEAAFYASYGVRAVFVGHPLADEFPLEADRAAARAALNIAPAATLIALLPGSRVAEVARLSADFAGAAACIGRARAGVEFIAPMATAAARRIFEREAQAVSPAIRVCDGDARQVLAACDVALVASGTATLEAMLSQRPMVVAYKLAPVTAFVARRLGVVKSRFMALPNLLAGRLLVPEFLQEQVSAATLAAAVLAELDDPARTRMLQEEFRRIHIELRCGGAARAASAILECAGFAA